MIAIPIYGNWCGPGYGGGDPTDAVDQACMVHDLCYDSDGYSACSCDAALVRALRDTSVPTLRGELTRLLILTYFSAGPCRADNGWWTFNFLNTDGARQVMDNQPPSSDDVVDTVRRSLDHSVEIIWGGRRIGPDEAVSLRRSDLTPWVARAASGRYDLRVSITADRSASGPLRVAVLTPADGTQAVRFNEVTLLNRTSIWVQAL